MSAKHTKQNKKLPIIIISVVIILIVIGISIFFIVNSNSKKSDTVSTTVQTTQQITTQETTVTSQSTEITTETETVTSQQSTTAQPTETKKIVVPETSGVNVSYFSKTFLPYKAIDNDTNQECSLKEVFGSSYSSGNIVFYSNGSFSDNMSLKSSNSGSYVVQNQKISATYSDDKNMNVTVSSWSNNSPDELIVNYGGYNVYFK